MNDLYFACNDCQIFIDAGYRWAYWTLEVAGIVTRGRAVDIEVVLNATEFWQPPPEPQSGWLYQQVLPPLREFLQTHRTHKVIFAEQTDFASISSDLYFEWLQLGYLLEPMPRYLVDILGLKTWAQVTEYMRQQQFVPTWWESTNDDNPSLHERGKQKFESLLRAKH